MVTLVKTKRTLLAIEVRSSAIFSQSATPSVQGRSDTKSELKCGHHGCEYSNLSAGIDRLRDSSTEFLKRFIASEDQTPTR